MNNTQPIVWVVTNMKTLTITAHGEDDGDFLYALEEIVKRINDGFIGFRDSGEDRDYIFHIDDKEVRNES